MFTLTYSKTKALELYDKYQYLKGQFFDGEVPINVICLFPQGVPIEETFKLYLNKVNSKDMVKLYSDDQLYHVVFFCITALPFWIMDDVESSLERISPVKTI